MICVRHGAARVSLRLEPWLVIYPHPRTAKPCNGLGERRAVKNGASGASGDSYDPFRRLIVEVPFRLMCARHRRSHQSWASSPESLHKLSAPNRRVKQSSNGSMSKPPAPSGGPAGIGTGKPVHPFAVTVEEPVAVSQRGSRSCVCADDEKIAAFDRSLTSERNRA